MAISPLTGSTPTATNTTPATPSLREQSQTASNTAIMQSQQSLSVQSGNEPLALLYKTAIEALNEELAPALGENASQQAVDNELDVSPEATAERIVQGATGFFEAYKCIHPEQDERSAMSSFMSVIRGGIDKGFAEAKDILQSLRVLEGDVELTIGMTYEHVQTGLQSFVDHYFQSSEDKPSE